MRLKRFACMDPHRRARMDLVLYTFYPHFNIQSEAFAVVVCRLQLSSFIWYLKLQPYNTPTLWVLSGPKPNQNTPCQRCPAIPLWSLPSAPLDKTFSPQLDLLSRLPIGILHICHNHHNRWLCKNIQSSVKFPMGMWKKMLWYCIKCAVFQKVCNFTHIV